jgi:flavin reductase (DIM6/NTAB) family NADH-FMN oxidoreductase RutF
MSESPLSVFRRLTNGVYVVGVAHGGRANAFTAAWITQVSFDPLLVAVSVNPTHTSYPLLTESGVFAVSVLRQGQLELARQFGTQSGRDTDKLVGVRWQPGALGAPLLSDAAAHLECRVAGTMPAGDHELVLGRVVGGRVISAEAPPMSYAETGDLDGSAELYPPSFRRGG